MNRTANMTRSIALLLCLTPVGCIKVSAPSDKNSTTSSAANSSGEGVKTSAAVAAPNATSGNASTERSNSDQNAKSVPNPISTTSDPQTKSNNDVVDISFDDIKLPMQEDMVFRPFMLTDRVKELDGKRIRISGYMLPDTRTKGIKQFVLLKNTECKFGPGGQADHLLNVLMTEGQDARFRSEPISIEGRLTIKPFQGPDGNTWSIYDIICDRVTRYRPRR
ncbi:MAG: DUF3299 domain-containing protein [Pirellulaceae bacterium]|nr:DUF3299 domain-containing protein [Pirellulaceae bacterium]